MRMHNPPHPGGVLREYLGSSSVTGSEASPHRAGSVVPSDKWLGGISAEMALRLSQALGTSPELWTGMRAQYDLWRAAQHRRKKSVRLTVRTTG